MSYRGPERVRGERGLTLIEVMLALTLLSIVVMSLGGLMYQVVRQTRLSALVAFRSAAQMNAVAWAQTIPWDSIPSQVGWTSADSIGQLVFRRYMTYTTDANWRTMTIVINPEGSAAALVRPETLTVTRAKPVSTAPLKVR